MYPVTGGSPVMVTAAAQVTVTILLSLEQTGMPGLCGQPIQPQKAHHEPSQEHNSSSRIHNTQGTLKLLFNNADFK
jgi:hypothetical protein